MRVKELIELLQKMDPEYEVFIACDTPEDGQDEIGGIEQHDANREVLIW